MMNKIKIVRLKWWQEGLIMIVGGILGVFVNATPAQSTILCLSALLLANQWLLIDGLNRSKNNTK